MMRIVIDHHDRGMVAVTQADHGEQGELSVFGSTAELDSQLVLHVLTDILVAHQPAGDTVA
jgi:hypothetical protein